MDSSRSNLSGRIPKLKNEKDYMNWKKTMLSYALSKKISYQVDFHTHEPLLLEDNPLPARVVGFEQVYATLAEIIPANMQEEENNLIDHVPETLLGLLAAFPANEVRFVHLRSRGKPRGVAHLLRNVHPQKRVN